MTAGKQDGSLLVWTVQDARLGSTQEAKESLQKGRIIQTPQPPDSLPLTSAFWTQGPKSSDQGLVGRVASSSAERDLQAWRLSSHKVRIQRQI